MAIPIGPGGYPVTNEGLPYIHLKQANYMKQIEGMPKKIIGDKDITDIYKKNKGIMARRLKTNMGFKTVEEGRKMLAELISIYNAGFDHKEGMEESLREGAMKAVDRIKSANPNFKYKYGLSNVFSYLHENVNGLQEAVNDINDIVDKLESLNANIINYYGYNGKSPFSPTAMTNGIRMLNIDKKSQTSFINLKKTLNKLEMVTANNTGKLSPQVQVTMPDGSTETVKTKGALWGVSQRLINIQGTILEAVGLATLERSEKEIEDYIKSITSPDVKVEVVSDPGGKILDKELGRMVTNTSDFSIKVTKNGTEINLGLSAKAQYKSGPAKAKTTTFKTTTVDSLLRRGGLLNTITEYRFLNDMAGGKWRTLGSNNIRKYLAALGSLDAIGGTVGGDETYLLVYLDKIISVEEFFQELITSKKYLDIDIKNSDKVSNKAIESFGRGSISKLAKESIGTIPNTQLAYQRSKALQILIHEMEAQVQLKN